MNAFTEQELRLLAVSDAAEGGCVLRFKGGKNVGGRPRTKPDTPRWERARQMALARYYRKKGQADV